MSTAPELRARLAANEVEHAALAQQLDDECLRVYATEVQGRAFSAAELWRHQVVSPELREVFAAAGVRSARQLGKQLERLARGPHGAWTLERVGVDRQGAIWATVRVREDSHHAAGSSAPTRI